MPSKKGGAPVQKSTSSLFPLPGVTHRVVAYRRSAAIFTQGADCAEVMYLQHGSVKLCVLSPGGKEAIVSVLQAQLSTVGSGALRDSCHAKPWPNLSITGHLRGFSDQPVAEIVQCGEPISAPPRSATPRRF